MYSSAPEFHDLDFSYEGFEWIDFKDAEQSIISFIRKSGVDRKRFSVVVCNMTPIVRYSYRIGVPNDGFYKEILNSDAKEYGGSGVGNLGGVKSEVIPWHELPHSVNLTLPPLAIVVLEYEQTEVTGQIPAMPGGKLKLENGNNMDDSRRLDMSPDRSIESKNCRHQPSYLTCRPRLTAVVSQ